MLWKWSPLYIALIFNNPVRFTFENSKPSTPDLSLRLGLWWRIYYKNKVTAYEYAEYVVTYLWMGLDTESDSSQQLAYLENAQQTYATMWAKLYKILFCKELIKQQINKSTASHE